MLNRIRSAFSFSSVNGFSFDGTALDPPAAPNAKLTASRNGLFSGGCAASAI
jgi:hypothetical protein